MDESSPITIIVGALIATLAIGIAAQQVNNFGTSTADHSDEEEVRSLRTSIETQCQKLSDLGSLAYSESKEVDLRSSGFNIEDDTFIYDPNGENKEISVNCAHPVDFNHDLEGDYDVPIGEHDASIEEVNGEIKVEFQ